MQLLSFTFQLCSLLPQKNKLLFLINRVQKPQIMKIDYSSETYFILERIYVCIIREPKSARDLSPFSPYLCQFFRGKKDT